MVGGVVIWACHYAWYAPPSRKLLNWAMLIVEVDVVHDYSITFFNLYWGAINEPYQTCSCSWDWQLLAFPAQTSSLLVFSRVILSLFLKALLDSLHSPMASLPMTWLSLWWESLTFVRSWAQLAWSLSLCCGWFCRPTVMIWPQTWIEPMNL